MMGFWQPVSNLRDYISQNPPVVTFFLCLLSLGISFICISSYTYTHTPLPNPDEAKDWNRLLSSLSQLQLCVKTTVNSSELVSPVPSPPMARDIDRQSTITTTKSSSSVTTLHLSVPLFGIASSDSGSLKDLSLITTLTASELSIGDKEVVTLEFLFGNSTHTCLTISAPAQLLPMRLLPPNCSAFEKNISPIHVEVSSQLPTASHPCYSLYSKHDPTLTVMLTQEEQIVAVNHLLEVGVFLLGVCCILCLGANLTHSVTRRYNWNGLDLQNEPLMDT